MKWTPVWQYLKALKVNIKTQGKVPHKQCNKLTSKVHRREQVLGYPLLQPKQVPKKVKQLSGCVQQIQADEEKKNVLNSNTSFHIRSYEKKNVLNSNTSFHIRSYHFQPLS